MDYGRWYSRISAPFRSARRARTLDRLDKGCVLVLAAAYLVSLFLLACTVNPAFWKAAAVPLAAFAGVTALRRALNLPRPYEQWPNGPLLPATAEGRSCPSRHVASAAIIAMELFWLQPVAGAVAWVLCAVVAFTRIVGGVHYPRDVAAALAFSGAIGAIGFYLVP